MMVREIKKVKQSGDGRTFPKLTNGYKSLALVYPYKGSDQTLIRPRGHDG